MHESSLSQKLTESDISFKSLVKLGKMSHSFRSGRLFNLSLSSAGENALALNKSCSNEFPGLRSVHAWEDFLFLELHRTKFWLSYCGEMYERCCVPWQACHLHLSAWAQFCCKMWGESLVWNQYSHPIDAEVTFYIQIPNLISRGVWRATLITLCFVLADDLHTNILKFVAGNGTVVQTASINIVFGCKQAQQYSRTH